MGRVSGHNRVQSTSSVALDDDILRYLMWFLDRKELLALMMTCHALYSMGIPALLALPIVVGGYINLVSFCDFMYRDLAHRTRCLKRLSIDILHASDAQRGGCVVYEANPPEETMRGIIEVFYTAVSLEELDITLNSCTLQFYPQLSSALRMLPSVRVLGMVLEDGDTKEIVEIVSDMRPLDTLRLNVNTLDDISAKMIHRSQSLALRKLTVTRFTFTTPASIRFPRLEYLDIKYDADVALLTRLCPHIKHLHMSASWVDADSIRARSMLAQAASPVWPELEVVSGGLLPIYSLALRCQLASLETDVERGRAGMFRTVLADSLPRKLLLRVNWWMGSEPELHFTQDDWNGFRSMFLDAPESLTEVTLKITLEMDALPLELFLAHIVAMCDPLEVAKLEISLHTTGPLMMWPGGKLDGGDHWKRLHAMNSARFAQDIAEHIITLSEFSLVLPPDIISQWKIRRHQGAVMMQLLD
ncbi:hypothetical protein CERSUDRAFT_117077 [Gelatoporia subvermispora B]|uniref:F-box domain-containing protein n=1 Tax=Ceriporiopsis subvermispora (strain B) TaxID=914234 RepID=M2R8Y2_CERS8|nr:hypothetical protein CERSUDRAFT_117077 [Gelatoporia subvermispora B]